MKSVRAGDLVLLPGDLSMAQNHRDLQPDLAWLERLPGTKVLSPGNHDRWWNDIAAIRPLLRRSMLAVEGDAVATHGVVVCGTAGTPVAFAIPATAGRPATADREMRIARAGAGAGRQASSHSGNAALRPLALSSFDAHAGPAPASSSSSEAGVTACVYGHLHNESEWSVAVQGMVRGVHYHCVAADAIGFRPLRIGSALGPLGERHSRAIVNLVSGTRPSVFGKKSIRHKPRSARPLMRSERRRPFSAGVARLRVKDLTTSEP